MSTRLPDIVDPWQEGAERGPTKVGAERLEAHVERLERVLVRVARDVRRVQQETFASVNDCQDRISAQALSSDALVARASETAERGQRSLERLVQRLQERLVEVEARLDDHAGRAQAVHVVVERTTSQLARLDRTLAQTGDQIREIGDEGAQRLKQWASSTATALASRFDTIAAAVDRERLARQDDVESMRQDALSRTAALQQALEAQSEQQALFEKGFRRFIGRFQGEMRDLFVKLQENVTDGQAQLTSLVQAEGDERARLEQRLQRVLSEATGGPAVAVDQLEQALQAQIASLRDAILQQQNDVPVAMSHLGRDLRQEMWRGQQRVVELLSRVTVNDAAIDPGSLLRHLQGELDPSPATADAPVVVDPRDDDSAPVDAAQSSTAAAAAEATDHDVIVEPARQTDATAVADDASRAAAGGDVVQFGASSMTRPMPIDVPDGMGRRQIIAIGAGRDHAAAITSAGLLLAWGANDHGQCGISPASPTLLPATLVPIGEPVRHVACGFDHTVVCTRPGTAYTFGSALNGRLGQDRDLDLDTPTAIAAGAFADHRIVGVGAGQFNSGFLDDVGRVWVCGAGDSGQIGEGERRPSLQPCLATIPDAALPVVSIAFGDRHAAAVTSSGALLTWGAAEFGCLGHGNDTDDELVPRVVSLVGDVVGVACGERHTTALTRSGAVYSFGSGETHQIGVMDNVDQVAPVHVASLSDVVAIAVGSTTSLAVARNGDVHAWGYALETPVPRRVDKLHGQLVTNVAAGGPDVMLALVVDGQQCFEFAPATRTTARFEALLGKQVAQIAAGAFHFGVVDRSGQVLVWGEDRDGLRLGINAGYDVVAVPQRVPVSLAIAFKSIACAREHSVALTDDGKVYTWGSGETGRLGHGDERDCPSPTLVGALSARIDQVAAGQFNSLAITDTGALFVWGAGRAGQVGNGSDSPALVPEAVGIPGPARQASLGDQHCVAILEGGQVFAWGDNELGQCGITSAGTDDDTGTIVARPEQVTALNGVSVTKVSCGDRMTAAVSDDGRLWTWGDAQTEQLGRETHASFDRVPGCVSELGGVVDVACGTVFTVAITGTGDAFAWGFGLASRPVRIDTRSVANDDAPCTIRLAASTSDAIVLAT